jgi:hypothetical protein
MKKITWKSIDKYPVAKIKPTPNNYKLKTEDGTKRLHHSIDKYGRAGQVILNLDGTLINGNSRVEKAKADGDKYISASVPNRMLTKKEFTEFSALFDAAVAGEVDMLRIKDELGTTAGFFKEWGFELPKQALNKLAELEANEAVVNPTANRKLPKELQALDQRPISLLFSRDEAEQYITIAESLYKKYKVDNVTDLSMKLMLQAKKLK